MDRTESTRPKHENAPGSGQPPGPVLIYDGVCVFCSRSVRFMVRHERPPGVVRFAPMQSEPARALLAQHGFDPDRLSSVVLIEDGEASVRSEAVLRLTGYLRSPWSWLGVFRFIPRPILDAGYRLLAKHRYRVFGRRDRCELDGPVAARTLTAPPTPPPAPDPPAATRV